MSTTDYDAKQKIEQLIDESVIVTPADAGFNEPLDEVDDAEQWDTPTPLPNALPPVDSLAPELLPEVLRPWVMDIANRMQCPPDFPAVGMVTVLSSLVGARVVIGPKKRDDWRVVPNLWGLIVGRPSVMKSPALAQCMSQIKRLEMEENKRHDDVKRDWDIDQKLAEITGEANEKKAKKLAEKGDTTAARALLEQQSEPDPEPTARRYIVTDATVEKLGEILAVNEWGLLAYRDELYGLLKSLDREGQEGSRSFYLQAYDGNQGYTFDRIMRGHTHLKRVCLSMLGGIQPARLQSYVRDAVTGGSGDDGLLQRFSLAVWPNVAGEFKYVDQWPDTEAKNAAFAVFQRLNDLQPTPEGEPQEWRFSPTAQEIYKDWAIDFETRLRGGDLHDALVAHLGKYRKLVPALALLFALIDTPENNGTVQDSELIRALAWADYLESHARRIYAAAVMPETTAATALMNKLKAHKLVNSNGVMMESFTARDIMQKNWAGLTLPDEVEKATKQLTDYGWLRKISVTPTARGGRPTTAYEVHPCLIRG